MKGFSWFIFANHQVEYIVSLGTILYSRMDILWLTNIQQNLQKFLSLENYRVYSKYCNAITTT